MKKIYCGFEFEFGGGSLQGQVDVSYKKLVQTFGRQNSRGDEYKIDAQWCIITPKGLATIYNYKDGKNYCGKDGLAIKDITDWHIGGRSYDVVPYILNALK